nr:MAG TPA: hypothetical protein [Caudoviricetes sp.]
MKERAKVRFLHTLRRVGVMAALKMIRSGNPLCSDLWS